MKLILSHFGGIHCTFCCAWRFFATLNKLVISAARVKSHLRRRLGMKEATFSELSVFASRISCLWPFNVGLRRCDRDELTGKIHLATIFASAAFVHSQRKLSKLLFWNNLPFHHSIEPELHFFREFPPARLVNRNCSRLSITAYSRSNVAGNDQNEDWIAAPIIILFQLKCDNTEAESSAILW